MAEYLHLLSEIVYESGLLRQVDSLYFDEDMDSCTSIVLTFQHRIFTITAIASDDTIELYSGNSYLANGDRLISKTEKEPWCQAIGKRIIWAWSLTNQQGYEDSLQFHFSKIDRDSSSIDSEEDILIQLIVVASSLETYWLLKAS
ncbi:MAG: DUF6334 family protein [Cyanobacteriota bacterium]|nr:DUF6334 family protein [Cyanobacteriota bacterium]